LIDRGHATDALKQLDLLAAQDPVPKGVETLRASALYAQGNLVTADQALKKALAQDAKDQTAIQLRGLVLYLLGKPSEAIPYLQQAHDWAPQTRVDPAYILALCYLDTRRYDDARHAFASQFSFPPDSAASYLLAARMLLRQEYIPVAQESVRKALELDPQLPLAHLLLGEIALAGEHLDEAISELELERQRNPLYGNTYDRLGDAYIRRGDYAKAIRSLEQAVLIEPNSTGPYILLGKAFLKQQDAASAAGYLERAEKMDPANYMTHNLLGQAYRQMGRLDEARQQTDKATQLQADSNPKLQNVH
jgi:tetratricopeptide (TPR) repeat protein